MIKVSGKRGARSVRNVLEDLGTSLEAVVASRVAMPMRGRRVEVQAAPSGAEEPSSGQWRWPPVSAEALSVGSAGTKRHERHVG
jgi:hypothetical protein